MINKEQLKFELLPAIPTSKSGPSFTGISYVWTTKKGLARRLAGDNEVTDSMHM
jgi:hypothetical protein